MTPDREREKSLFAEALDRPDPAARRAFLDEACGDDAALRTGLERLLAVQQSAEAFLTLPKLAPPKNSGFAAPPDASPSPASITDQFVPGEGAGRIGRYKLLQRLGQGGWGVVYLAEQQEPVRREVALKIIRLGMDTENIIARFEMERQALALMDHPNIARVLDAGATETGRPFFVMELVRGIKITDYCDQHRLDTAARLDLFVQICHAIQHAHQKGIIHRDIKPSNILVAPHDGIAVPKVIDFGIAKAVEGRLGADTAVTANVQLAGTPAYMSPEQADHARADIDTRSDIYSLGALLHELLAGRPPFDSETLLRSGIEEMRRLIREREPRRPSVLLASLPPEELKNLAALRGMEPSRLLHSVRGDLDWIVMRCLEKDRRRRYETAYGLAMDIRRHLDHEPVTARPPSRLYRIQKLVRRNQVVCVAGLLIFLALVAGLGASTWLFLREREARREQARLHDEAELARASEVALRRVAESREKIAQAAVHLSHGKNWEADALVAEIPVREIQPSLECVNVLRTLGDWHAIAGHWPAAGDRYSGLAHAITRVDASDSDDVSRSLMPAGSAICEQRAEGRYAEFCRIALARFALTSNPIVAEQVIKSTLLLPADAETLQALAPLARVVEEALGQHAPEVSLDPYMDAWRCFALALHEHRLGRHQRSLDWAEQCLAYSNNNAPRRIAASLLVAMASHHLHREADARFELADSRAAIRERFRSPLVQGDPSQGFWFDWINARILLGEAVELIER